MHFDLQPGQVIDGKYEVRHKLGQGGMGAVYLVQHLTLKRSQALKLIQTSDGDEWDADEEEFIADMLARFTRETQTLAKFAHPNIIFATDAGTLELELVVQRVARRVHMPFLVMEFFDGHEGKKWTVRERPSAQRVLGVARQLANGLACAHNAGVLHRDLKPQNILIGKGDAVKIVDFGLAKPEGGEADLTRTKSSLAGTLAYLAPEYASASAGRRQHTQVSDLWALGCCLYFLLTHRNVFTLGRDEHDWELLARVGKGEYTPIADIRQDLSAEFLALMQDLLQRDPDKRIPSANVLLQRLEAIPRADDPAQPSFVPPKKKEPLPPTVPERAGPEGAASSGTDLFSVRSVKLVTPAPAVVVARSAVLDDLPSVGAPTAAMRPAASTVSSSAHGAPSDGGLSARDLAAMRDAVAGAGAIPTESMSAVNDASLQSARQKPAAPAGQRTASGPGDATLLRAMEAEMEGGAAPRAHGAARAASVVAGPPSGSRAGSQTPLAHGVADDIEDEQATPSAASVRLPAPSFQSPASVSSAKEKKAMSALVLPAVAVAVIGAMGATLLLTTADAAKPTGPIVKDQAPEGQRDADQLRESAESEMRALEQEKRKLAAADKERQSLLAAAAQNPPTPSPRREPPSEPLAEPSEPKKIRDAELRGSLAPAPSPAATPTPVAAAPDSPWARFGTRPSTNTGAAVTGPAATTASAATSRRVGVRIPVRVNVDLASQPAGPVIASVTQATDIGDMSLPVGTEIHGQTSGAQNTRLTINFTTAIVNGKNIALTGTALGLDGKPGLQGVRAGGDGSDIAAAAAAGAVGAVGAGVAAALGEDNVGGAAVRGGAGAATQNTQRLNTSQDIVMTRKGARFLVYITK
ncbi:MAG: protein kinase [Deltaproteobacteria bacterium]|nr:protein kinase [Deltaproteobacteria bacterium]